MVILTTSASNELFVGHATQQKILEFSDSTKYL